MSVPTASYDSDDDDCRLPADTLAVLQEFLKEKELREQAEQSREKTGTDFEEDWQLSQFWYNTSTKEKLASVVRNLRKSLGDGLRVALLSAPSLYQHVKAVADNVTLFEFDQRFESVGSAFHHFDYKRAIEEDYLDEFKESFDIIVADPPFLAEECIEKLGIVVRKIAKPDCKVVLCSGYVVREWAEKHLKLELCKFEPEHERNLGNQFSSYANFNLDQVLAEES